MTVSEHPTRPSRYPAALVVLLLASTLGVMAGAIVVPVLELIRNDLDVTGTAAGLIITTHGLAIAISSPLIGKLIDRWGIRIPMAAGLVLYGLAGGAGIFTTTYAALILSRLLLGIGAAFVFTGTTVALLMLYQGRKRDQVMGWRTTATTMGGLVWPLLAGVLGGLTWHAAFATYLVGVPLGIAALLALPAATRTGTADSGERDGAIQLLRRYPTLLAWYGLMTLTGILLYALAVFMPQRLAQMGVENPFYVSLFMVLSAIASSIVGLAYARLRAHLSYSTLLRATAICWVGAFLILGASTIPALLFPAAALFGLGNGLMLPVITVLIGDTPAPERRGQATSLSATAMFVGQFVSPLIFGPFMAATSIRTGYLAAAGLSALILVMLTVTRVTARTEQAIAKRPANDSPAATGDAPTTAKSR